MDLEELNNQLEESASENDDAIENIKDDDELAEILAISKKMLRKKDRR